MSLGGKGEREEGGLGMSLRRREGRERGLRKGERGA